jgi:hypothetical protein
VGRLGRLLIDSCLAELPWGWTTVGMARRELLLHVSSRTAAGRALLGMPTEESTDDILTEAVDDLTELMVAHVIRGRGPTEGAAKAVYEAIVLDPHVGAPFRLKAALRSVDGVSAGFSRPEAEGVLRTCLARLTAATDPYADPTETEMDGLARSAARSVLVEQPELDPVIHTALHEAGGDNLPPSGEVLALAIQQRRDRQAERIVAAVGAWRPTVDMLRSFASLIDVNPSLAVSLARRRPLRVRAWRAFLRTSIRIGLPILIPFIGVAVAASLDRSHHLHPPNIAVSAGDGLVALGVVLSVQVLFAELVANRLPGAVAKSVAVSSGLFLSYTACVVLIATGTVENLKYWSHWRPWGPLVGLPLLVVGLALTLRTLLRQTDTPTCIVAFARQSRGRYRRAGRRFRSIRRAGRKARADALNSAAVRLVTDLPAIHTRAILRPPERGYLLLRSRRLKRLAERPRWRSGGLRLVMLDRFGVVADGTWRIAAIEPDMNEIVRPEDIRQASRVIRMCRVRKTEAPASEARVLISTAEGLLRIGDRQGAQRIVQGLHELLADHADAASEDLEEEVGKTVFPAPAIMEAALAWAQVLVNNGPNMHDLPDNALTAVLELTDLPSVASFIVQKLPDSLTEDLGGGRPPDVYGVATVLRLAALRALELHDTATHALVRTSIRRLVQSRRAGDRAPTEIAELASTLAAALAWGDESQARAYHKVNLGFISTPDLRRSCLLGELRIGGASLRAGATTLAVEVALSVRAMGAAAEIRGLAESRDVQRREATLTELTGAYLGQAAPAAALVSFAQFAEGVGAAVS